MTNEIELNVDDKTVIAIVELTVEKSGIGGFEFAGQVAYDCAKEINFTLLEVWSEGLEYKEDKYPAFWDLVRYELLEMDLSYYLD